MNCVYCDDGRGVKYPDKIIDRELSADEFLELFRIVKKETDGIVFTGGEPFIRNDLEEILCGVRNMGYNPIVLLTNGLNLDKRLEALKYIDILMVSFDTLDLKKADRRFGTKTGVSKKIFENIILAKSLSAKVGFKLFFNVCITPDNVEDVDRVVDFCVANDIGFVPLPAREKLYPGAGLRNNNCYKKLIRRIKRLKLSGFPVLGTMGYLDGIENFSRYRCHPTLLIRIQPDGNILYPCNKLNNVGGNILKLKSYRRALDYSIKKFGDFSHCQHSCQVSCYMNFSLLVENPMSAIEDNLLKIKGLVKKKLERRKKRGGNFE